MGEVRHIVHWEICPKTVTLSWARVLDRLTNTVNVSLCKKTVFEI